MKEAHFSEYRADIVRTKLHPVRHMMGGDFYAPGAPEVHASLIFGLPATSPIVSPKVVANRSPAEWRRRRRLCALGGGAMSPLTATSPRRLTTVAATAVYQSFPPLWGQPRRPSPARPVSCLPIKTAGVAAVALVEAATKAESAVWAGAVVAAAGASCFPPSNFCLK